LALVLIEHLNNQLLTRDAQMLRRHRRVVGSPCAPQVHLRSKGDRMQPILAFCSNDYLGLAGDPLLRVALAAGALQWGTGSGASHLVSGHLQPHEALEDALAEFLEPCIPGARALTFCTGYMANIALLTALGDAQATLFADKLNHASLIDGALLAKARLERYAHGRVDMLASRLERCNTPVKLIVTDAVFSMDGNLADLPALLDLAKRHDAWVIVDDAHGFGVLGKQGRGSLSHFGLCSQRFIYMGTLGKAAGVAGAFVAAHPTVIEWLIQAARSYIYTTAAPPAIAQALLTSLTLIGGEEGERRRSKLAGLIELLRVRLRQLIAAHPHCEWALADSNTAIQPLLVRDSGTALRLACELEAQGVWIPAIRPPTVPAGTARLRITLSATHNENDVLRLVDALGHAMEALA